MLTGAAKERSLATILVGHVTKDSSIAGPRTLEHLVDVVLHFEGDRHSQLRMVRAVKNRYGPADEVGCFDLGEYGLIGLPDPSGLFLSQRSVPVPGTCVTVTLEERRPLVAEVQTLVGPSVLDMPRRVTSGLDGARVGMVLAVLQRHTEFRLGRQDVYAATVGGVRLTEPSVDLAMAVALASSVSNLSVPAGVIAVGEVGLAGEVRRVSGVARRLAEAERMGFRRAIVPAGTRWPALLGASAGGPQERSRDGAGRRPEGPDGRPGGGRRPAGDHRGARRLKPSRLQAGTRPEPSLQPERPAGALGRSALRDGHVGTPRGSHDRGAAAGDGNAPIPHHGHGDGNAPPEAGDTGGRVARAGP